MAITNNLTSFISKRLHQLQSFLFPDQYQVRLITVLPLLETPELRSSLLHHGTASPPSPAPDSDDCGLRESHPFIPALALFGRWLLSVSHGKFLTTHPRCGLARMPRPGKPVTGDSNITTRCKIKRSA
ncbi:hypothetical protein G7K_5768-t1 [Saitoella complicata NRRL Y-17804]|uniref:Uncharacterized protein n=1 Tax=Saitoella complicata (strain BCRC 22490 / CBS 7301 / JCM 7358 / NBRC 10748 / NRRL Y-17804) TaxID=698492 RepID=A0A0E9NQH2_SAICN|nr:hypothetical protein G7K_5768-t1 [Saitoella complicata NRRL Y-17804]